MANAAEQTPEIDLEKAFVALCELADADGITLETDEGIVEFNDGTELTEAAEGNPELIDDLLKVQEPVFLQALMMDEPTDPVEPVEPVEPLEPVDPVAPVEPVKPVEPVEPIKPVEPVQPVPPVAPAPAPSPTPGPVAPAPAPSPAPAPQPIYSGDWGVAAPVAYSSPRYAGTGDQLAFTGGAGLTGVVAAAIAALGAGGLLLARGRKPEIEL
ncbi:hypothetical protein [Leucobacter sp. UCMA 4100]|uniref:hypothetical protein n=1 Tax=Leucobacter sp. UCMA 4100 TaxID=2810534 RepID=UPI0022EA3B77|nr:hypothetical protein [Leucobacter sp. UCMA 4100]